MYEREASQSLITSLARFHAWQSSLLFTFIFVVHVIISWSSILSWLLFAGDLGLIGLLVHKAYVDGMWFGRRECRIDT